MKCNSETCNTSREERKFVLDYLQSWKFGNIITQFEGMSKDDVHAQVVELGRKNPRFLEQLYTNPRLVYMIALDEGILIDKMDYICQIQDVQLVQDTQKCINIVLPTCHYGCQIEEVIGSREGDGGKRPETNDDGTCHVCGIQLAPGQEGCDEKNTASAKEITISTAQAINERSEIERLLVETAQFDKQFKDRLLAAPALTYKEFAKQHNMDAEPAWLKNVKSVDVWCESDQLLYFVMPAEKVFQDRQPASSTCEPIAVIDDTVAKMNELISVT